jgi:hypothetical protein
MQGTGTTISSRLTPVMQGENGGDVV